MSVFVEPRLKGFHDHVKCTVDQVTRAFQIVFFLITTIYSSFATFALHT